MTERILLCQFMTLSLTHRQATTKKKACDGRDFTLSVYDFVLDVQAGHHAEKRM